MTAQKLRVPTQERARRTRAALLEAARAEFSESGYAKTTASRIAKRAGVSAGSFYQYFPDKDTALRELGSLRFAQLSEQMLSVFGPSADASLGQPREQIRAKIAEVVTLAMDYHRADPGLHEVLTERRPHDEELDTRTSAGERALVEGIIGLLHRWDTPGDRETIAFAMFALVEGAAHAHVLQAPMFETERVEASLVEALLRIAKP